MMNLWSVFTAAVAYGKEGHTYPFANTNLPQTILLYISISFLTKQLSLNFLQYFGID